MSDFIPDNQFVPDAQPASVPQQQAPQGGPDFIPDSHFESDQDKYGGLGGIALAGLAGVGRGGSLGTSDEALTQSGLVNPETLAGLKAANPIASGVGNLVGTGALIYGTGGLAAPLEGALGAAEVAPIAAKALAYGAEGAVFGAGNSISDHALGDPNLNASKVLSNIGLSALFGGAVGIGGGLIGKALGRGIVEKGISDVADQANASAETSEALAGSGSSGPSSAVSEDESSLSQGLNPQKGNAQEIIKAGEAIGAPVTEAMTSTNRWLQRADDALMNGAPTYSGIKRANLYRDGFEAVNKAVDGALDTGNQFGGGAMSARQFGDAMQESLAAKIATESAPIEAMYQNLKPHMAAIDIGEKALTDVSKEILALPEAKLSFAEGKLARQASKDVLNLDSVDDLKNYKSALMRSVSPTASPGEKYMVGQLADKLTELEENSIIAAAKESALPPEVQEQMRGLIADRKAANAAYKPFITNLKELTKQLGKKNPGGTQTAIHFIQEDLKPEKLADRLFSKSDSKFNEFFAKKFPEEAALMRQYQKQALREAASKTGELSPRTFFTNLNKLEPEIQSAIFAPDELAKLKSANTYLNAIPKNFNPSGTSGASAFRSFFESPTGAAIANARDFGIEAFMKAMGTLPEAQRPNPYEIGAQAAEKFNKMTAVQKMAQKVNDTIASKSKAIFTSGTIKAGSLAVDRKKK